MSGHTPGPWRALPDDAGGFVITAEEYEVAEVMPGDEDSESIGAAEADARLIAAAPDLLAALVDMLALSEIPACANRERAVTAIAKAEGRTA